MRLEKYETEFNSTKTQFEFISHGPNGNILKSVLFSKMKVKGFKNLYNLAFGDKDTITGDIDDFVITNNEDRDKVLATVVSTVFMFFQRHSKAQIFFRGSTLPRTRLYRMAISKYLEELDEQMTALKAFLSELFAEKTPVQTATKEQELELAA